MVSSATVLAIAAVVYDQDTHSAADMEFLAALTAADCEWMEALNSANTNFGGSSEAWHAVKRLATRSRDKAYASAFAAHIIGCADARYEGEFTVTREG